MEIAVLLAAGLRDWIDFGVIIGILMLNATVGWYQEKQAADVVASLKGDIAMRAMVIRDGQEQEIKARELVPGDIVSLQHAPLVNWQKLIPCRLSSKMVKLFPPTRALSARMIIPTVTNPTSRSSKLNAAILPMRRTKMRTDTRSTVLDTRFWPLINLP